MTKTVETNRENGCVKTAMKTMLKHKKNNVETVVEYKTDPKPRFIGYASEIAAGDSAVLSRTFPIRANYQGRLFDVAVFTVPLRGLTVADRKRLGIGV